jgi:hypothetical protein
MLCKCKFHFNAKTHYCKPSAIWCCSLFAVHVPALCKPLSIIIEKSISDIILICKFFLSTDLILEKTRQRGGGGPSKWEKSTHAVLILLLQYHTKQTGCLRNKNASDDCQTASDGRNGAVHTVVENLNREGAPWLFFVVHTGKHC